MQAIVHSLTHIESWAVDLSWDIIARFGGASSYALPWQFFDDFVAVAEDEARHFSLLAAHLAVREQPFPASMCTSHHAAGKHVSMPATQLVLNKLH